MFTIYKLRADHVIDFAAEELKKYLRMMMLQRPEIDIVFEPNAKEGFRLGLLENFTIPFEGGDAALDDVVHIDTDACGGILAGSNSRSVLFAVYRYLKLNGCRFFAPGVDLYTDGREAFRALQRTCMEQDFSWDKPAQKCMDLFYKMRTQM